MAFNGNKASIIRHTRRFYEPEPTVLKVECSLGDDVSGQGAGPLTANTIYP